ncbi:MAG: glycosyltransferase family 2 protein [Paludibacteraceae bacterium]|nr:glycosyltransferase family 2 protein [Paludibacteraceae bacterium]
MNPSQKISLVMATFNGQRFLREQLDSIYSQTLVPNEVIVVDDCSKDATVDILKEYSLKYGLKYFVNETNLGVNGNFEKALSLAKGEYICISDQDDVWFKDKIERSFLKLKEIENDAPACVSSNVLSVDSDLKNEEIKAKLPPNNEKNEVLYNNGSQGCTLMFNKKLKDIILPLSKYFIYDHFIGLLSYFVGERFFISEPLMYYRHHGGNVVSGRKTRYHKGLSEAMAVYYILKRKERFYLLKEIQQTKMQFINENKKVELFNLISFYDVDSHLKMFLHVMKNDYYSWQVKLYFFLFLCILVFNKDRRVETMSNPLIEAE